MNNNERLRAEIESRRMAFHCTNVALRDKARAHHLTGSDLLYQRPPAPLSASRANQTGP